MVYEAYNLSLVSGDGVQPMMQTVNDNLMFGYFGILALITIGVIMLLAMISYSNNLKKSVGLTSIICAILSIAFRMLNLVPDETVLVSWVIAAVCVLLAFLIPD